MSYLWIGLGSALGGMARHLVGGWALAAWGPGFPWGTFIVNVAGSFLIGLIAGLAAVVGPPLLGENMKLFLGVGLCGGFTTFSAFSLQTLNLVEAGAWGAAALNVGASVLVCVLAVWLGAAAGASLGR